MARNDQVRLMTKIARMYYEQSIRQAQITERLNIHQSTVSRLLRKAEQNGIVRISVTTPQGIHPELEEALESRFELSQAVVVDSVSDSEEQIARDLGSAAAFLLESFVKADQVIGISSWSGALLEMINNMHPTQEGRGTRVVQIVGGLGNPAAQTHATYLAQRLAALIGGSPVLLPAPGITTSAEARRVLIREPYVRDTIKLFDQLDAVLVGIGAIEPSRPLLNSGNVFSAAERASLAAKGAIGDVCLQYFNAAGQAIATPLADRVIGIKLPQLKRVKHVIGIAGGKRKVEAIRGALNGRWINVLITDRATAKTVLEQK